MFRANRIEGSHCTFKTATHLWLVHQELQSPMASAQGKAMGVRRLLIGGSPRPGRRPALGVNDGGHLEALEHLGHGWLKMVVDSGFA
jgi:hypothetical protein